jgi:hypothetical protein
VLAQCMSQPNPIPTQSLSPDLTRRLAHVERFMASRPDLAGPLGQRGVQLVGWWLWEYGPGHWRRESPASGPPRVGPGSRDGGSPRSSVGAIFWDLLLHGGDLEGSDPAVICEAAVAFLTYLGSRGNLPGSEASAIVQQGREEALAFVAMTLGLLPTSEAEWRAARYH